jgi:hypothetical protein
MAYTHTYIYIYIIFVLKILNIYKNVNVLKFRNDLVYSMILLHYHRI